jgi:hypothetical protein
MYTCDAQKDYISVQIIELPEFTIAYRRVGLEFFRKWVISYYRRLIPAYP